MKCSKCGSEDLTIEMMQVGGKTKKYAFAKTAVIRGM